MTDVQEYDGEDHSDDGDENGDDDCNHDVMENNDNVAQWIVFHLPSTIHTYIHAYRRGLTNQIVVWTDFTLQLVWCKTFTNVEACL